MGYGIYDILITVFYSLYNDTSIGIRDFLEPANSIFSPALIIWYIQSKGIRVRPLVIAWSFSLLVTLMLGTWAYVFFVNHQSSFSPPRSLFGLLTSKPREYLPGLGNSNYLIPYRVEDSSIAGFARYFYFFHGPESLALVCSFICLLSLEVKAIAWKAALFLGAFFILLTSGTRSAWLSLSFVLFIWFLLKVSFSKKSWLLFSIMAVVCAVTLMAPPVTHFGLNRVLGVAESTSEYRGDSTDVRAEIYRRTWEGIVNSSNIQLILGRVVPGETVLPGYAPAMVGTHSFYLGSLLYRRGLFGTIIFIIYWISLIDWILQTREDRPKGYIMIFLLFSLTFCVMAMESVVMPTTLIVSVAHMPQGKLTSFQLKRRLV